MGRGRVLVILTVRPEYTSLVHETWRHMPELPEIVTYIEALERVVLGRTLEAVLKENRTLKRVLTDPTIFSGIGNAHSDEILLLAGRSPVKRSRQLSDDEIERLHEATLRSLREWVERLRAEAGDGFPTKVTAFHPEMGAHGKFGKPCPRCGSPIQRIVYASHETNYCATCQTRGKLLEDGALSKLLREDWPKTLEELEERRAVRE